MRYNHSIISRLLKDAVRLGMVGDNVARKATAPRQPKTKQARELCSADQTRTFLDWARNREHRVQADGKIGQTHQIVVDAVEGL